MRIRINTMLKRYASVSMSLRVLQDTIKPVWIQRSAISRHLLKETAPWGRIVFL